MKAKSASIFRQKAFACIHVLLAGKYLKKAPNWKYHSSGKTANVTEVHDVKHKVMLFFFWTGVRHVFKQSTYLLFENIAHPWNGVYQAKK